MPDEFVGKPVGFTCSTFDLLHAGHILMLAEAKTICDFKSCSKSDGNTRKVPLDASFCIRINW